MCAVYGHANTHKTSSLLVTNNDIAITLQWLQQMRDPQSGLLYYMDKGVAHFLSPLATAKTAIWAAKVGQPVLLQQCAKALVTAQQQLAKQHSQLAGALASSYQSTPKGLEAGQYVYACEQLVAIYAWLQAYEYFKEESFLKAAIESAKFLKKFFLNGYALGTWQQPYPIPFNYLTVSGAFENTMRNGLEYLWISAFKELYKYTNDAVWHQIYEDALAFYLVSQADNGLWFDAFLPNKKQWVWYQNSNVVADNMLRCAIAASLNKQTQQVDLFLNQLQIQHQDCLIKGYLSTVDGADGFIAGDRPYYDIVATGLLRNLYDLQGNKILAAQCQAKLKSLQDSSAGFFWGSYAQDFSPVSQEKAVITTLWASANLFNTI